MLRRRREITAVEYPNLLHLLPLPDNINIEKLADGSIMTDTCHSTRSANKKVSALVDGKTHNLPCCNHLINVHVKNVLEALTDFIRAHYGDSLDKIAPDLRVSPGFISFARAFDKMFSLCANYPKGWGEIFREWMKENHTGELLFCVERAASGGRQDVASMAALAMYWNRNFCVEFLEEMMVYCGKQDNILAGNLWSLLASTEIISVACLWSIFHLSIIMPTRWLLANTHMLADDNWGYISLRRMLDKLKDDLKQIIAMPELIHDETFMMGMMDEFRHQLPDFDAYVTEQFEHRQTCLFNSSTKVRKLKELCRELFHPSDQDNKESTALLEDLAVVAAEAWIGELVDPTKGTWQFMSDSEGEYSYEHSSDTLKEAMLGVVAVNDLAESSFAGVTAQVEVYGRIGMANAAAISDMARNGFLSRPSCNQDLESGEGRGLFHGLREGLKITAVMAAVDMAPQTRESNNAALDL